MKCSFLLFVTLFLTGCSTLIGNHSIPGILKERTYNYRNIMGTHHDKAREIMALNPQWYNSTVAVQSGGPTKNRWASGVCIGVEPGYSWVATAYHVVKNGVRYIRYTWLDTNGETHYVQYDVVKVMHHAKSIFNSKDFTLLKIKGELPHYSAPIAERPSGGFDIITGYPGVPYNTKTAYEGRAEKGTSGGGVFHSTGGLYGIVSTHTQGVGIVECLLEMKMEHIIGDKR